MFRLPAAASHRLPRSPGHAPEKTMEVRFFAPGSLVSNLDFVESIFGNGGDPCCRKTTRVSTRNIGLATRDA